jgi:hypothetical protein
MRDTPPPLVWGRLDDGNTSGQSIFLARIPNLLLSACDEIECP